MSGGWGERLDRHFEALHAGRKGTGLPVFALEHGLSSAEFLELSQHLHKQLRSNAPLSSDWLGWVVYGAELGYDFDGQEYWTNFETRTPGWVYRADRAWLRDWFKRFHTRFQGFRPRGAWAEWFSIISWPITHAILPRDLQTQLAQTLYHLRFGIASRLEEEPAAIGRYIASHGDGSSRFRNFLQQEELVGRIAIALLGGSDLSPEGSLLPETLNRIVNDLEKGQSAKAWLGDARKVVEQARIKGVGRYGSSPSVPVTDAAPSKRERHPSLHPSIFLQRADQNEWIAIAEFPSYRPLCDVSQDFGRFLRTTRCKISGADGFLPAGWLLAEGQRRVLTSWPDPTKPLIEFEKRNGAVEKLLMSDATMSPGPLWLFELAVDGRAQEITSLRVRPGRRYLLVSREELKTLPCSVASVLRCGDCHAREIDLPTHISDEEFRALRSAGLLVARTISIWPAGLPARRWDGESLAEWYLGEVPSFGIGSDHEVRRLTVSLDGGPMRAFPDIIAGCPVFISLPDLAQGSHLLKVDAEVVDGNGQAAASTASLEVRVQPPVAWSAGTTTFKGMVPVIDPPEPSLDDFWEGRVKLSILGPVGYGANVCIELLDAGNGNLATEVIMEASLPCRDDVWERHSTQFIQRWASPWAYLSASSGNLIINSDDLGTYRIPLRRDVRPVRFIWHSTNKTTQVRLIDDHHGPELVSTAFYPFSSPCRPLAIEELKLQSGFEPPAPGGMFVLQHGEVVETLAVSMPQIASLSELAPEPAEDGFPSGASALSETQSHLTRWSSAKIAGPLADLRRGHIVHRLEQHYFRLLCGTDWWQAERDFERSGRSEQDLRTLASKTGTSPSFAVLLSRDLVELQALDHEARITRFVDMANRYGISDVPTSRAAITVCDKIDGKLSFNETSLAHLIALGKRCRPIVRAARFLTAAPYMYAGKNSERIAS